MARRAARAAYGPGATKPANVAEIRSTYLPARRAAPYAERADQARHVRRSTLQGKRCRLPAAERRKPFSGKRLLADVLSGASASELYLTTVLFVLREVGFEKLAGPQNLNTAPACDPKQVLVTRHDYGRTADESAREKLVVRRIFTHRLG